MMPSGRPRLGRGKLRRSEPEQARETPYALAIFDFDGTLADSARWFCAALNETARRYKFKECDRDGFEALRALEAAAIIRRLGVARWKLPLVARHMRKLAARDRDQILPFPGAGALLRDLHEAGVRLAIVSSNARPNVLGILGPALSPLIAHYACGASTFGKAAKFARVLKVSGVAAGDAIAIGDEVRDIAAARNVGIASGAVAWGYASPDALKASRPSLFFQRMEDVRAGVLAQAATPAPDASGPSVKSRSVNSPSVSGSA